MHYLLKSYVDPRWLINFRLLNASTLQDWFEIAYDNSPPETVWYFSSSAMENESKTEIYSNEVS